MIITSDDNILYIEREARIVAVGRGRYFRILDELFDIHYLVLYI